MKQLNEAQDYVYEPTEFVDDAYYYITSAHNAKYIDGKSNSGPVYLNDGNQSSHQRWRLLKTSKTNWDGDYYIYLKLSDKTKGVDVRLDGSADRADDAPVTIGKRNDGLYQKWYIEPCPDDPTSYYIYNYEGNDLKDAVKKHLKSPDTLKDDLILETLDSQDPKFRWHFTIVYSDTTMIPGTVKYGTPSGGKNSKTTTLSSIQTNNSSIPQDYDFGLNFINTFCYTYSFTETLMVGMTSTFTAEAPGVSGSASFTVELTLQAGQSYTRTVENSYNMTQTIEVKPKATVTFSGYFGLQDDAETPFTANMRTKSKVDALYSGYKLLSPKQNANELRRGGATCFIDINDIESNCFFVTVAGKVTGAAYVQFISSIDEEQST